MTVPNVYSWKGELTAVSSVMHGGESLGTVRYLRRERFLLDDGTVEDVPVLSGNMLRGILRRLSADLWWEALGRPRLSMAVVNAIWSGGALAKSTTDPLSTVRLQQVREVCPVVGLFGAAGGGRIVEGTVQVGKAVPVCRETASLLRVPSDGLLSLWDLTQIEYFSKAPGGPPDAVDGEVGELSPMRFGVESFITGSRFLWDVSTAWASPVELSLWCDTLAAFCERGQVGGMSASGFGHVDVSLTPPADLPVLPDWRDALPSDVPQMARVLGRLD